MTYKEIIDHIHDLKVMQLATVADNKPWICTVYFIASEDGIYWLSFPSRRHSEEIAKNSNVALAFAIKLNPPVIGVQIEGTAKVIEDESEVSSVIKKYVSKYDVGHTFLENFQTKTNKHSMYKLTPNNVVLFDELHFPIEGRVQVQLD